MLRNFIYKTYHWEFWPAWLFNIPIVFFWLWHSLRARSLFFFSAANPAIETGGLLGESKEAIMQQVPDRWKPSGLFVQEGTSLEALRDMTKGAAIRFPIFAKPDIGERGFRVAKLENLEALAAYHGESNSFDYLIQEYVAWPLEVSVLHYRFPKEQKGHISSVCVKKYLSVTGDGKSRLGKLIEEYPRARFHKEVLLGIWGEDWEKVLGKGEELVLVPVGNHSRGATFLNANDQIDEDLCRVFDEVSHSLNGILFARYDLKCASFDALRRGEDFTILEINGAGAEPAHIYDPDNALLRAYRDMFRHWNALYRVGRVQHTLGVPYMTWAEAREFWKRHRGAYKK